MGGVISFKRRGSYVFGGSPLDSSFPGPSSRSLSLSTHAVTIQSWCRGHAAGGFSGHHSRPRYSRLGPILLESLTESLSTLLQFADEC
jgi:hypothetical protein